jgi:hypothetical protein
MHVACVVSPIGKATIVPGFNAEREREPRGLLEGSPRAKINPEMTARLKDQRLT